MGDRHRHVFVDDHVLDGDIIRVIDDLRAPLIAVFFLDLFKLIDDDSVDLLFVGENRAELGDQFHRLAVLFHDLVALQAGQTLQAEIQNRLGLNLAQSEVLIKPSLATRGSEEPRIKAITASRLSSAMR